MLPRNNGGLDRGPAWRHEHDRGPVRGRQRSDPATAGARRSTDSDDARPKLVPCPQEGEPRPARSERFLWLPVLPDLGNAGLLLAMVLDGGPWPNALSATARILGVTREAVRTWRTALVRAGLVTLEGDRLVPTESGRRTLSRCHPLPRRLLADRRDRPTPGILRAAAAVLADAVGWRANRHGCRADHERAAAAGVGRALLREARRLLERRELAELERLKRGRAGLVRARLVLDDHGKPTAARGRSIGEERRAAMAEAAERGRRRVARGANESTRVGANESTSPIQEPTAPEPQQAKPPRVPGVASRLDGCPEPEGRDANGLAQALAEAKRAAWRTPKATDRDRIRADLARLQPAKLLAMPAQRAVLELLRLAGVFDRHPKRLHGFAVQVARAFDPAGLLLHLADIVLGKVASVGAVLRRRVERRIAGEDARNLLTRSRVAWPLGRFLDELRAAPAADAVTGRPTARATDTSTAGYSATAEDRAATDERALLGFAVAGNWPMVAYTLNRPVARERGWSPAWLSDRSGVPEPTILAGLAAAAARRATA